jgi:HSP20 family protein
MKLDVKEDEKADTVRAEMKQEKEEKKDEKVIYSERSYGMVSRSFSLPAQVDPQGAKAEYKDGVLNLVLPKKANAQGRRLTLA